MEYDSMEFDKCYIYDTKENKSIKLKKSKDISGNERYVIKSITTWTAKDSEDQY